jgi:hypothetical protein
MRTSVEKDCKKYGSVKLKKKPRPERSDTEAAYDDSHDTSHSK